MDSVPNSIERYSERTAYRSAEWTALRTAELPSYHYIYEKQSAELDTHRH